MIALLQRVAGAEVKISGASVGRIGRGLLVFYCAERGDTDAGCERLLQRILKLRCFPDDEGRMNRSVQDVSGALLVVSQFTLAADTDGGNRPGFSRAAAPDEGRNPPGLQLARAGQTLTIEPGSMVVLDGASIEEDERAFAAITDAIWPEGQVDHPWAVTLLRDGHARAPGSVGGAVLVPTYPVLFSGTILENLTLFDEGRTEAALSLSRQLGLEAKVGRLAQGYRTPVGSEARPVLSPGVVKRVALVRALAQRPTLLLLDRPAVSLDREGVAALAALLAEAPRGMTVVMTTHAEPLRAVAHVLLPLEARSQPAEAA